MSLRLEAKSLIERTRRRIQDEGAYAWTDDEILEAADDILNELATSVRLAGRDHELDCLQLPRGSFEGDGRYKWTYRLPPYVQAVRLVEGSFNGNRGTVTFPYAILTHREIGSQLRSNPTWSYDQGSQEGVIALYGPVERYDRVDVWFNRRYASLHHGVAGAGTSGTTLEFDQSATRTGPLSPMDDVYSGLDVMFLTGAAMGEFVSLDGYAGAARVATFAAPLTGTPAPGDEYALGTPLAPVHNEYFLQRIAHQLFLRSGNMEFVNQQDRYLHYLRDRFQSALDARMTDQPKTMWSSRTRR